VKVAYTDPEEIGAWTKGPVNIVGITQRSCIKIVLEAVKNILNPTRHLNAEMIHNRDLIGQFEVHFKKGLRFNQIEKSGFAHYPGNDHGPCECPGSIDIKIIRRGPIGSDITIAIWCSDEFIHNHIRFGLIPLFWLVEDLRVSVNRFLKGTTEFK
jgi:hypothetical protein